MPWTQLGPAGEPAPPAQREQLTIDRLADAIAATYRASQHGQHCPIWVDRATDPWIRRCDCWILERAQKAAAIALDAALSPNAALSAGGGGPTGDKR